MIKKQFELTGKCNLRCEFCYNKEKLGKWNSLSEDFVLDKSGTGNLIFLGGGEPSLYSGIEALVKKLTNNENTVVISTNGIKYIELPKKNILIQINLPSINEDTYKEITGRGLVLKDVVRNIDAYKREHEERVYINFVAYDKNFSQLEEIACFCKEKEIPLCVSELMPIEGINSINERKLKEKCVELAINLTKVYFAKKDWREMEYFVPDEK